MIVQGIWLAILLPFFFSLYGEHSPVSRSDSGRLILEINNIKTSEGIIWVGIYHSASSFLIKEEAIVKGYPIEYPGRLKAPLPDLPFGTYAIALFHDINNNGEMDRNFFGIPSEPYAFSQPPRTKWRLPSFEEVQFNFQYDGQVLRARLSKW